MRPEALNPLFAEVQSLEGVGPKLMKPLEKLGLTRVKDLAYHLPERFVSRRAIADLDAASEGEQVIIALTAVEHRAPRPGSRGPYRVLAQDRAGNICALSWFGKAAYSAKKLLPVSETRWIAGRLDRYGDMLQIVHPDHIEEASAAQMERQSEPVYRLSEGLTQPRVASLAEQALARLPELPEWIEPSQLTQSGWPRWAAALRTGHVSTGEKARDRLAYDELLANSLALLLVKAEGRRRKGAALVGDGGLRARLHLPFALTGAQTRSIAEIEGDMAQEAPMLRLLQGDVGAGKTVVALNAMLIAVEAGKQAALLAPTEILARQHFETLRKMLGPTGVEIALLTGRAKGRERESILMGLLDGSIQLLVGTHAIFQDTVNYRDLGLVVIDEQHRFGVLQRAVLQQGQADPHTLVMTATPIPRTIAHAVYGDLDVSTLDEQPPGRQPVATYRVGPDDLDRWWEFVRKKLAGGRRGYVVVPAVEESKRELASIASAYESLANGPLEAFRLGLVHGRLSAKEKAAVMEDFRTGKLDVLVATSVIEVGIDVPEATIMTILDAESFGLAQLHQLRGRVARGTTQGLCGAVTSSQADPHPRVDAFVATTDGFALAEQDLVLRGPGDLVGTKQSGMPPLYLADLLRDGTVVAEARRDALEIFGKDPTLADPGLERLRKLILDRWGETLGLGTIG